MSVVYIAENGTVLGIEANRLTIKYKNPVNFRGAISLQISELVKAIENEDFTLYNPIQIR